MGGSVEDELKCVSPVGIKLPWHKGSKARQFIKEDGKIETLDFPRTAPDENPQEHVWKNGRSEITHNKFIDNIDKATDEFVKYLRICGKNSPCCLYSDTQGISLIDENF